MPVTGYDKGIPAGALVAAFVTAAKADTGAGGLNTLLSGNIQAGRFRPPNYSNPYLTIYPFPGSRRVSGGVEEIPVQFTATADNLGNSKVQPDVTTLDSVINRIEELFTGKTAAITVSNVKIFPMLPGGKSTMEFDPRFEKEHYGWIRLLIRAVRTG